MRNAALPWPLAGLLVAIAVIVQDYLTARAGAGPSFALSSYQVAIMTIGVVSLALILLPRRRLAYLLCFLICAALMGWALWLQYGKGLEPCPLCMFQRVAVVGVGIVALVAFLHNPGRRFAMVYAVLTLLIAGTGAALAGRQIWLQALPKDEVPACGMGIGYMMDTLPFIDVITKVLAGSGECAEKMWELFGLSIAGWTFTFFIAMIVAAFALARRE